METADDMLKYFSKVTSNVLLQEFNVYVFLFSSHIQFNIMIVLKIWLVSFA